MNIYMMKKPKKINSVSVTLALIGLVLAYAGWFLVPAFWPIFQLTGVMRSTCNTAYRELNDEKVMAELLKQAKRTGLKLTKDNFRFTREPYTVEELEAARQKHSGSEELLQKRGKACVLEMRYVDDYTWPLIGKTTTIPFEREVRVDLKTVEWEKQCTCVTVPSRSS